MALLASPRTSKRRRSRCFRVHAFRGYPKREVLVAPPRHWPRTRGRVFARSRVFETHHSSGGVLEARTFGKVSKIGRVNGALPVLLTHLCPPLFPSTLCDPFFFARTSRQPRAISRAN